jgi:hypothetical protein
MATILFGGKFKRFAIKGGPVLTVTFSGLVTLDGLPVAREVQGINVNAPDRVVSTISDAGTGAFVLPIRMAPTDEARIICVGAAGENSRIYEHLTA